MIPALAGFAATFAVTGALLAAVIWADNRWQSRRPDTHEEPPSRLDLLDWARYGITDPPSDRSAPSPQGRSGSAGAYPDEMAP
jgi:hypothetical protein